MTSIRHFTLVVTGLIVLLFLLAGGIEFSPAYAVQPSIIGTWKLTGSMQDGRSCHTATLLTNGKVLVAGGFANDGSSLLSAELYNPSSKTWSSTGFMHNTRYCHTA